MIKSFLSVLAAAGLVFFAGAASAQTVKSVDDLVFLTEDYPPFNYKDASGKLTGISIDLLDKIFETMGSQKKAATAVTLGPWGDYYTRLQNEPNVVLFAMTYTTEREKMFKMAGSISPTKVVVMTKKGKASIKSKEDLKNYTYTAIKSDIGETQLKDSGVDPSKITSFANIKDSIAALRDGKVDGLAYEESCAKFFLKQNGLNVDDYEVAYELYSSDLSFAFNRNVPDSVVSAFQDAINEIKMSGDYMDIVDKYLR